MQSDTLWNVVYKEALRNESGSSDLPVDRGVWTVADDPRDHFNPHIFEPPAFAVAHASCNGGERPDFVNVAERLFNTNREEADEYLAAVWNDDFDALSDMEADAAMAGTGL
jgi:hypothetical protein